MAVAPPRPDANNRPNGAVGAPPIARPPLPSPPAGDRGRHDVGAPAPAESAISARPARAEGVSAPGAVGPASEASEAGASGAPMRGAAERLVQTLWFEGVGLAIVTPLYGRVTGAGIGESFTVLAVLAALMMVWSAGFNAAFDWAEWRLAGRVASDRPLGLRALHALAHEATAVLVSCPIIATMTGLGWQDALLLDVTLTMTYAAYGYVFHLVFDALRPVRARARTSGPGAPAARATADGRRGARCFGPGPVGGAKGP
jgi:uncharacterized membrane protein